MTRPLGNYFNYVADMLEARYRIGGVGTHKGDIGTNREVVIQEFLSRHLPPRLRPVLAGQAFGTNGEISKQLDIALVHDISMLFMENHKPQLPVESLASIISVKSKLNSAELVDALENIASVPQLDPNVATFLFLDPINQANYFLYHPTRFVFAFEGLSAESCEKTIKEFYVDRAVPRNRRVTAVLVNRSHLISLKDSEEILFQTGKLYSPNVGPTRGWPLMYMAATITKIVPWLSFMQMVYSNYFRAAFGEEKFEPPSTDS